MVAYEDDGLFPATLEALWKLLEAHRDDAAISRVHPQVLSQRTLSRTDTEAIVERTIDAREKPLRSKWRITLHPPDVYRWDILASEGPWAVGNFIENRYSPSPGGTRIQSRGELKITVLPFFLSQRSFIRRILGDLDTEDLAAIKA
jgi:hypothetical protein